MLGASVALAGVPMMLPPWFYLSLFGTVADFFQVGRHSPSVISLLHSPSMARAKATGGRRPYLAILLASTLLTHTYSTMTRLYYDYTPLTNTH